MGLVDTTGLRAAIGILFPELCTIQQKGAYSPSAMGTDLATWSDLHAAVPCQTKMKIVKEPRMADLTFALDLDYVCLCDYLPDILPTMQAVITDAGGHVITYNILGVDIDPVAMLTYLHVEKLQV